MILYPRDTTSREAMNAALRFVGADLRSAAYFEPKRHTVSLLLPEADFRAAAYIKQELLARGGDAVVARGVISGEAKTSPVLLLGTPGQLRALRQKLDAMDCWGLPDIRAALSRSMAGLDRTAWTFPLRDGRSLHLDGHTRMMGIVNLTPDSFFPGSRIDPQQEKALLDRAESMFRSGVSILDLGAESTRPGFTALSPEEEALRLIPAVQALRGVPEAVLSVDTWKGTVARQAVEAGADIVNDISGLGFDPISPGPWRTRGPSSSCPTFGVTLTRCTRPPSRHPWPWRRCWSSWTTSSSRPPDRHCGGPDHPGPRSRLRQGYEDNLRILDNLEAFRIFGRPLLVGHSRKGFIGRARDAPTRRTASREPWGSPLCAMACPRSGSRRRGQPSGTGRRACRHGGGRRMTVVAIGLGTNLGNRLKNLWNAVRTMKNRGITIKSVSDVFETPVGVTDQPSFLNACVTAETDLPRRAPRTSLGDRGGAGWIPAGGGAPRSTWTSSSTARRSSRPRDSRCPTGRWATEGSSSFR